MSFRDAVIDSGSGILGNSGSRYCELRSAMVNTVEVDCASTLAETTLATYLIPDGAIASAGDFMEFVFYCGWDGEASTDLYLKWGGSTVFDYGAPGSGGAAALKIKVLSGTIAWSAANTQVCFGVGLTANNYPDGTYSSTTKNQNQANALTLYGKASAVGGAHHYFSTIKFFSGNKAQ